MTRDLTFFWIAMGVAALAGGFVMFGIPLVGWWFDYDRRPAWLHRRECRCWNCNDYDGLREEADSDR